MSNSNIEANSFSQYWSMIRQAISGKEYDYTSGSLKKAILLLAVPMILELSLESVFAVVDMFFVGKLGSHAIATVGLTEAFMAIVYSLAMGLSTAATAIVARRIGEKNPKEASHAAAQALMFAFVIIAVITIAGIIFAPDILRLMGAQPDVVKQGSGFTRIMLGGSLVIVLLFLINGIFRGAGNAAMAMKSLWIASILNIILCPLLINGYGPFPQLGLEGAAIATTIGRGSGVIYQLYHLFRGDSSIRFKREYFKVEIAMIKSIFQVAWPATLQFLIQSGSWIVLARIVADTGNTDASAGYQIAMRNIVFFILPAWGLSNAAATLVGQNLGANQPDRAERSVLLTAKYNGIFMTIVMLAFLFLSEPIISIYTKDAAVLHFGSLALRIVGAGFTFYGIGMVMIQALNGAGDTRTPTWINFVGFWLFQIPISFILAETLNWGPSGAFAAIPLAESAIAVVAFYFFKKGKWKMQKV